MRYVFKKRFYKILVRIIDLFGNIMILPFRILLKKRPKNVRSILVIRLDHLGDVIFSTPIPQNLKNCYPEAKITFLVSNRTKEIVINNPYVNEVICYDACWFNRDRKRIFEFKSFFKLLKELRKHRYDLGFDLRGDLRHIILMTLAGVRFRVGYGITGGGFLLHRRINYKNGLHSIEHNLDLLRNMAIDIVTSEPQFYSSTEDKKFIQDFLKNNNLTEKDFIAIIHPFAGNSSKNWPDNKFADLIQILFNNFGAKIILVGSKEDRDKNDNIIRMSKAPAINISGNTTLRNLWALSKVSDIFIGVDSGPSHIATLTGNPTVILYSGTNRTEEWSPRSDNVVIIQKDVACKNCERLDCPDNLCMKLISVEDVLKVVKQAVKL